MISGQFDGLLIHTATVYRRRTGSGGQQTKDPFGQPTRDEEESHQLACRASRASGGERMQERSHDVVQSNYKLFLDAGADLREDDVVTITDPAGVIIADRAEVTAMDPVYDGEMEHHREAKITVQRQTR